MILTLWATTSQGTLGFNEGRLPKIELWKKSAMGVIDPTTSSAPLVESPYTTSITINRQE